MYARHKKRIGQALWLAILVALYALLGTIGLVLGLVALWQASR